MSESPKASAGHVVSIVYRCLGIDGTVHDSSDEDEPLVYLHGAHNVVPGLEEALEGKSVGDSIDVLVPSEKAYGIRMKVKPIKIRRSELPEGAPKPFKGMQLTMQTKEGKPLAAWVSKIQGAILCLDPNHPLSGQDLRFEAKVVEIREASEEEKTHGHVHGPDGHHHDH